MVLIRHRHPTPHPETRCKCGRELSRFWAFCPWCGRAQVWEDDPPVTDAECYYCGWVVSDLFAFCPWCGSDIAEEGVTSATPLKAPRGFRFDAWCDWGCGGGVQYPMSYCPSCGGEQEWDDPYLEGHCPHCDRGVDDWMDICPWCGFDATGQDLVARALTRVRRLLLVSRIKDWNYRVLLRPGVSGVAPKTPKIIEIDRSYVVGARRRDEIPWTLLVGLICHELGHSFLYHHWTFTRTDAFKRVFGEVGKAYRVSDDTWVDFYRHRVSVGNAQYVTAYAATHPLEDFAEVFRFYVTRRGKMKELLAELGRSRKDIIVYEKFLLLHRFIRSLRGWR
ncbi:MAG: putative zinc-binding metallopeptidase [Gemmatimonadales bacterium]|nr:putative zinc-binding metallopeptidase [Gemmatimonadales bacterium]